MNTNRFERYYLAGQQDRAYEDANDTMMTLDGWDRLTNRAMPSNPNYEVEWAFYVAGHSGNEMPRWVDGWRYGNIPERGYSYNHRDNEPEAGVSIMAIDGETPESDPVSALFIAAGREIVRVSGWLIEQRGSDGEPLLIGCRRR